MWVYPWVPRGQPTPIPTMGQYPPMWVWVCVWVGGYFPRVYPLLPLLPLPSIMTTTKPPHHVDHNNDDNSPHHQYIYTHNHDCHDNDDLHSSHLATQTISTMTAITNTTPTTSISMIRSIVMTIRQALVSLLSPC